MPQPQKIRPIIGLTNLVYEWVNHVSNEMLYNAGKRESGTVIMNLWESVQTVRRIADTVRNCLCAMPHTQALGDTLDFQIQGDLHGISKQAPYISSIPPDCRYTGKTDTRLYNIVMECIDRYEKYVVTAKGRFK